MQSAQFDPSAWSARSKAPRDAARKCLDQATCGFGYTAGARLTQRRSAPASVARDLPRSSLNRHAGNCRHCTLRARRGVCDNAEVPGAGREAAERVARLGGTGHLHHLIQVRGRRPVENLKSCKIGEHGAIGVESWRIPTHAGRAARRRGASDRNTERRKSSTRLPVTHADDDARVSSHV